MISGKYHDLSFWVLNLFYIDNKKKFEFEIYTRLKACRAVMGRNISVDAL